MRIQESRIEVNPPITLPDDATIGDVFVITARVKLTRLELDLRRFDMISAEFSTTGQVEVTKP